MVASLAGQLMLELKHMCNACTSLLSRYPLRSPLSSSRSGSRGCQAGCILSAVTLNHLLVVYHIGFGNGVRPREGDASQVSTGLTNTIHTICNIGTIVEMKSSPSNGNSIVSELPTCRSQVNENKLHVFLNLLQTEERKGIIEIYAKMKRLKDHIINYFKII